MKNFFIEKYREYYKVKETKDEIFIMSQGENESMEGYEEKFQVSYKSAHSYTLDDNSLEIVFLRGEREAYMEILNLLENGNIFHLEYEYNNKVFKN
jgi:hypothetical protein